MGLETPWGQIDQEEPPGQRLEEDENSCPILKLVPSASSSGPPEGLSQRPFLERSSSQRPLQEGPGQGPPKAVSNWARSFWSAPRSRVPRQHPRLRSQWRSGTGFSQDPSCSSQAQPGPGLWGNGEPTPPLSIRSSGPTSTTGNRPVPAAPSPLNLGLLEPREPQGPPTKCQCLSKGSGTLGLDTPPRCVALGEPSPSLSLAGQSTEAGVGTG